MFKQLPHFDQSKEQGGPIPNQPGGFNRSILRQSERLQRLHVIKVNAYKLNG